MEYLQWPDYLVFVLFLLMSLGIGIYHALSGGRQRTTKEFIMADRQLGFFPTAISMYVSFKSAIAILGATAETYEYGCQFWVLFLMGFTINIIVVERIVVPWIYPLKVTSLFEYLEWRFQSRVVRTVGAFCGILNSVAYTGLAMYAPSVALEAVTGLPLVLSIPILAFVGTTYTALGGMKAVIWTDVFQCFIMIGGIIICFILGCVQVGSMDVAWEIGRDTGRLPMADFSFDPTVRHTFWGFLIGLSWSWIFSYGFTQSAIQRIAATKSERDARLTLLLNIPFQLLTQSLLSLTGLVVFAYYTTLRCDPLTSGRINNSNQILPLFVMKIFADVPGLAGLFIATLYGAALSSVSSSLSGAAAVTWVDIIKPRVPHWSDAKGTILNKILVIVYGIISTGISFLSATFPGPVSQVSGAILGSLSGPVNGLFLMAGLMPFVTWQGATAGTLSGLAFAMWMVVGSNLDGSAYARNPPLPLAPIDGCPSDVITNMTTMLTMNTTQSMTSMATSLGPTVSPIPTSMMSDFYSISYLWYGVYGSIVTVTVGVLVSLATGRCKKQDVDDELLMKFGWRLLYPFCQEPNECYDISKHRLTDVKRVLAQNGWHEKEQADAQLSIPEKPDQQRMLTSEADTTSV